MQSFPWTEPLAGNSDRTQRLDYAAVRKLLLSILNIGFRLLVSAAHHIWSWSMKMLQSGSEGTANGCAGHFLQESEGGQGHLFPDWSSR